jgi:fermentation-respiration switch protein FrsA (DUF1100 family)
MIKYFHYWKTRAREGRLAKDFFGAVLYLLKGYVIFVVLLIPLQRVLIYAPAKPWAVSPEKIGADIVQYKTADGLQITSWYRPAAGSMPTIVMFHGNAGNISYRYQKFSAMTAQGYGFLLAEYRGYGGNAGRPTEGGFCADARAGLSWLQGKGIAQEDIVIYGESIGTGVAVQMALEYPQARALVLEAPFESLPAVARAEMPWLAPVAFLALDRYENILKAPDIRMPLLVVHGSDDEVIPLSQGVGVFNAGGSAHKKMEVLKGGRHNDLFNHGLMDVIDSFLSGQAAAP